MNTAQQTPGRESVSSVGGEGAPEQDDTFSSPIIVGTPSPRQSTPRRPVPQFAGTPYPRPRRLLSSAGAPPEEEHTLEDLNQREDMLLAMRREARMQKCFYDNWYRRRIDMCTELLKDIQEEIVRRMDVSH
ncbi:hypothetical protein ScPMuIL_006761 [Solemya velum]